MSESRQVWILDVRLRVAQTREAQLRRGRIIAILGAGVHQAQARTT